MLTFREARSLIIDQLANLAPPRSPEPVALGDAHGRVLSAAVRADRDYPPFDRSTRDGYAVRAAEATSGARLSCVGEIKAGDTPPSFLAPNSCLHIMTGAAVPAGADAVVMIEHTTREADSVLFTRASRPGQNIVLRGNEGRIGQIALPAGARLGYAELAAAAQVGATQLLCAPRPRIAILSTGDEIVAVSETPGPFQIRNSNAISLAAQVRTAGAELVLLGNAADRESDLRAKISQGLQHDALILSGGVSMGKYDLVEKVLREMSAEFFFDSVAIRPGKPTVFAICASKPIFGLPGNPVSTMVTFELFVIPAIDILSGAAPRPLPLVHAILAADLNEKPGMTHFLPAKIEWPSTPEGAERRTIPPGQVRALHWQSSGDIAVMAQANCLLVVPAETEHVPAGTPVSILLRKDVV
jgi:molybdopterin molybdotransferase